MPVQIIQRNVSRCLTNDRSKRAGVKLGVIGDRQSLLLTIGPDPAQFDMAALLRMDAESQRPEYRNRLAPDIRRRLGMHRLQLHGHYNRRTGGQAQFREVFAFQMKLYGLAQVGDCFIQRGPLRHHRNFNALGHEACLIPRPDHGLYGVLEMHTGNSTAWIRLGKVTDNHLSYRSRIVTP